MKAKVKFRNGKWVYFTGKWYGSQPTLALAVQDCLIYSTERECLYERTN